MSSFLLGYLAAFGSAAVVLALMLAAHAIRSSAWKWFPVGYLAVKVWGWRHRHEWDRVKGDDAATMAFLATPIRRWGKTVPQWARVGYTPPPPLQEIKVDEVAWDSRATDDDLPEPIIWRPTERELEELRANARAMERIDPRCFVSFGDLDEDEALT